MELTTTASFGEHITLRSPIRMRLLRRRPNFLWHTVEGGLATAKPFLVHSILNVSFDLERRGKDYTHRAFDITYRQPILWWDMLRPEPVCHGGLDPVV